MLINLTNYQLIKTVYEDSSTVTYRARESGPKTVLIKALKAEYPTLEEIARLKHEYKIV